jgi:hypothetical protein
LSGIANWWWAASSRSEGRLVLRSHVAVCVSISVLPKIRTDLQHYCITRSACTGSSDAPFSTHRFQRVRQSQSFKDRLQLGCGAGLSIQLVMDHGVQLKDMTVIIDFSAFMHIVRLCGLVMSHKGRMSLEMLDKRRINGGPITASYICMRYSLSS